MSSRFEGIRWYVKSDYAVFTCQFPNADQGTLFAKYKVVSKKDKDPHILSFNHPPKEDPEWLGKMAQILSELLPDTKVTPEEFLSLKTEPPGSQKPEPPPAPDSKQVEPTPKDKTESKIPPTKVETSTKPNPTTPSKIDKSTPATKDAPPMRDWQPTGRPAESDSKSGAGSKPESVSLAPSLP
jgi:hypothetical protein